MNLRTLDLNLLVILDALLDEAHVSRAADRLGLSQPAVSNALQRCRSVFDDELLERGRGTMRRTARGEALRAPLKTVLAGVAGLIDPPEIALADICQTLRISMADFPAIVVTGPLLAALQTTAPGIDIVLQPWRGAAAARDALITGASDLALSVFPPADDALQRVLVLNEHYVVALRADHPAARAFSLARWLAYPHILVSGRGDSRGAVDDALADRGLCRRIGVVVPNFGMVPDLLRSSDMIALLPSRCVPAAADLVTVPPPVPVPGFPLHIAWHTRRTEDRGLQHVAGLLIRILADMAA